ncbi:hypothetical protein ACH45F_41345 [Catenuloplanes sp. NPDC020197]|uniref:Uncharacterized protein n=1 Tax=Catenuloplanes niger TaxID=587534 RepID=A0AAE3ZWX0_9ACTN|nr:hypothetical protein [Catenuloplanes niger]MDR7327528.1 hypothetical protein [Catenuloplanes niger]
MPAEPVTTCVRGRWRTTTVGWHDNGAAAGGDIGGGGGVLVDIAANGVVTADFGGMQPVEFTVQVAGAPVNGTFSYTGRATGTIGTGPTVIPSASGPPSTNPATPPAPPSTTAEPNEPGASAGPSGPVSGSWTVQGPVDWSGVRLTVDITAPVAARPFDGVPVGDYAGAGATQTGNVVDVRPLLDNGRYLCQGRSLVLFFGGTKNLGWILFPRQ